MVRALLAGLLGLTLTLGAAAVDDKKAGDKGAGDKMVDDTRDIHVRANDWFRIDFTRPAPEPLPRAPRPNP